MGYTSALAALLVFMFFARLLRASRVLGILWFAFLAVACVLHVFRCSCFSYSFPRVAAPMSGKEKRKKDNGVFRDMYILAFLSPDSIGFAMLAGLSAKFLIAEFLTRNWLLSVP